MNNELDLLDPLSYIPASSLDYNEWISIGMALKEEGYSCEDWDTWSQNDERYVPGECQKKWDKHFNGNSNPVTAGTLVEMAKSYGWNPPVGGVDETIGFGESIVIGKDRGERDYHFVDRNWVPTGEVKEPGKNWDQVNEICTYLETLFEPDEYFSFSVSGYEKEQKNGKVKWIPTQSIDHFLVGDTIEKLKARVEKNTPQAAIDNTFGRSEETEKTGCWIRINPTDGNGGKDSNVTDFRYALVESDNLDVYQQQEIMRELELPIAAMVHSGGKSIHAIVRIGAKDFKEYRERVDFLFDVCNKNSLTLDKQNRNPSRLSRFPGWEREGKKQFLIDTNIGKKDFEEWKEWIEELNDELPDFESYAECMDDLPPLANELIGGILREGHKMIIQGASKAGKSFMLIQLAIALSEGLAWIGKQCKKTKVLYINLELDHRSFKHRISDIYDAKGIIPQNAHNLVMWNLRGNAKSLDKLVPKIVRRAHNQGFGAIIVDPIYKVITGSENDAAEMAHFTNQFDKIANELNTAVIYCHHHSKGDQGFKKAADRSSGSGVFSRDPDAILDLIELQVNDSVIQSFEDDAYSETIVSFLDKKFQWWRDGDFYCDGDEESKSQMLGHLSRNCDSETQEKCMELIKEKVEKYQKRTAWRVESTLREFPKADDVNIWFDYPIHVIDSISLEDAKPIGDNSSNGKKSYDKPKMTKGEIDNKKIENIQFAFHSLCGVDKRDGLELKELSGFLNNEGYSTRTIKRLIGMMPGFSLNNGFVFYDKDGF